MPGREAALTMVPGKLYALMSVTGMHIELSEVPRKHDIFGVSRKRDIIGEARKKRRIKGGS